MYFFLKHERVVIAIKYRLIITCPCIRRDLQVPQQSLQQSRDSMKIMDSTRYSEDSAFHSETAVAICLEINALKINTVTNNMCSPYLSN